MAATTRGIAEDMVAKNCGGIGRWHGLLGVSARPSLRLNLAFALPTRRLITADVDEWSIAGSSSCTDTAPSVARVTRRVRSQSSGPEETLALKAAGLAIQKPERPVAFSRGKRSSFCRHNEDFQGFGLA